MSNTFPSQFAIPASASATGTTGAIVATLTPPAGRGAFIAGFAYQGSDATAAQAGAVTVTGTTPTATLSFAYPTLAAGAAVPQPPPLVVNFNPPLPAGTGNSIAVNGPALGAGASTCSVTAWGYYQ